MVSLSNQIISQFYIQMLSQDNSYCFSRAYQTSKLLSKRPKELSKATSLIQPSSLWVQTQINAMLNSKRMNSQNAIKRPLSLMKDEGYYNNLEDLFFQDCEDKKNQALENLKQSHNFNLVKIQQKMPESERKKCPQTQKKGPIEKVTKRKGHRKVRTTITREKIEAMNKIFGEYLKIRDLGGSLHELNLKMIGKNLELGYSTILHKFREFRANKCVKGGVLVISLQRKRKYKKSVELQKLIDRALQLRPFYTVTQLSEYIFQAFHKRYSRSIISRHLCQMGYSYKNLRTAPIEKHKTIFRQTRKAYASILFPLLRRPNLIFLYIDELACDASMFQPRKANPTVSDLEHDNPGRYVSLFVSATAKGVISASVKRGFFTKEEFVAGLDHALHLTVTSANQSLTAFQRVVVVTDMNKIHLDPLDLPEEQKPISCILQIYQAVRYYLPPSSPHFNPIDSIFAQVKQSLFKKEILGAQDLQQQLLKCSADLKKERVGTFFQEVEKSLKQELQAEIKSDDQREDIVF